MGRIRSSIIASALAAIGLSALSVPAHAEARLVLAPAGDWTYREFDDRCRASREFGAGEDSTTLWIEQGGLEPNYNVTLIGRPLRHPYGGGIHVRFGDEPEFIRSYVSAKSSAGRPVLLMYGLTMTQPSMVRGRASTEAQAPSGEAGGSAFDVARSTSITTLDLRTSIVQPLRLEIGEMIEPLGFLGLCGAKISGLLTQAGRAATGKATAPEPIKPDRWLNRGDYPKYLARANMDGGVTVRLTVNRAGRASSCFVVEADKAMLFDDAVCLALMKRAQFKPARDADGDPVASYFFYRVDFGVRR